MDVQVFLWLDLYSSEHTLKSGLTSSPIFLLIICMWWRVGYVQVNAGKHGQQKRVLDALELELQLIVNSPALVLRTKFGSSGKVAHIPNCCHPSGSIFLLS